jgi:monoamine oxidase
MLEYPEGVGPMWRRDRVHTATFDEGQYFNAGPSRIPHHHALTLHYCKELKVPIQVYNNVNENTYYFSEGKGPLSNKKVRVREVHNDMRGWMAELLAKGMDGGKIDAGMSKEDTLKVIEYLRAEGGLDIDKLYKASARRGYIDSPGPGDKEGKIGDPMTLVAMAESGLLILIFIMWRNIPMNCRGRCSRQSGGWTGSLRLLSSRWAGRYGIGAEVSAIHNVEKGVKVVYKDATGEKSIAADLCICTIPVAGAEQYRS